jgi:hypothetical protein
MIHQVASSGTIVVRARRDTLALVAIAVALTIALSSAIHSRSANKLALGPDDGWTGKLADVAQPAPSAPPFTSASLVVSTADLALPHVAVRPLMRLPACPGRACLKAASPPIVHRTAAAPLPPARQASATEMPVAPAPAKIRDASLVPPAPIPPAPISAPTAAAHPTSPTVMSRLNFLNHLPSVSALRHPVSMASDTVTGWFKRF